MPIHGLSAHPHSHIGGIKMKTCTKCKIEKPKTEFSKKSASKDGLYPQCKGCVSEKTREWHKANKDKVAFMNKSWREANKERSAELNRAWALANPERKSALNNAWLKANPERATAFGRNRRARLRNADGSHTAADIIAIFESQRCMCVNCKKKLFKSGKNKYHVDHILALSRGGSNDKYNLQCLCPSCNLRKNAKDPLEWAEKNGRLL
jgi:hypothetical protein